MTMTDLGMITANTRLEMKHGRKTYPVTPHSTSQQQPQCHTAWLKPMWSRSDIPALQMFLVGSQSIPADGSWLLQRGMTNALRSYGLDPMSIRIIAIQDDIPRRKRATCREDYWVKEPTQIWILSKKTWITTEKVHTSARMRNFGSAKWCRAARSPMRMWFWLS